MKKTVLNVIMFVALLSSMFNLGAEEIKKNVLASFDFTQENPCPALKMYKGKIHPKKVENGMAFYEGGYVTFGYPQEIKEMFKKPFGIIVDFTITQKAEGYSGGVLQLIGQDLRLTVNKYSLKFVVEQLDSKTKKRVYLSSKEPVELNKRVKFEVVSDGKNIYLYRDGKLDNQMESALPDKDTVEIMFGQVGGNKYYMNGIMHAAELYEKQ